MAIQLRTDHKWRPFLTSDEVPERVLTSQFDWIDEGVYDGFFKRYNDWHHLAEFERITPGSDEFKEWDGILNFSFSSGLVIKVSPDCQSYKLAYYWVTGGE